MSYILTVFVSDTSSLKSRALMLAFASSPYIGLTWAGGPMSEAFLAGPGFRWGFGVFAIVVPVVVSPLIFLLLWNQNKAKKAGLNVSSGITWSWAGVKQYLIEVDAFGILLLASGMALFLLPFSLYSYQSQGWRAPMIYLMLIFGGLLLISFVLYERFYAPKTFIPYSLLMDRTVLSACLMFMTYFWANSIWGSYFGSMLQAVWNESVSNASYISSVRRVAQCLFGILVGVLARWTGRFKWINLTMGVPLGMLAVGLMMHFRTTDSHVALVAMCQIFAGWAGASVVLTGELALMAPSNHQHIAVIVAVMNLFCSIGSACGGTVAAAVWTGVFPGRLERYLPEGTDIASIYADLNVQISYPMGSPERIGIQRSYADAQRLMLGVSLGLLGASLIAVLLWRNLNLKDHKQTKGMVA